MNKKSVFVWLLLGLLAVISFSCSHRLHKKVAGDDIIIYPPPPDTTRIQFLTTINSSLDITGKRSAFGRFLLGEFPDMGIVRPYGMALKDGRMVICDTQLNSLIVIDLEKHRFEYFAPEGRGVLKKPISCALDDDGYLYVADAERRQVVVFDQDLKYVNSFGRPGKSKPTGVFVKGNKIWVADFLRHNIYVYDKSSYQLTDSIGGAEPGNEDYLYSPSHIWITDQKVYVTDFGDFKIKEYTHDGDFIASVGSYGKQLGQFVRPKEIAVDKKGNLFVVDAGFENVQIFNKDGRLLMFFGGPYDHRPGDMWLPVGITIDYDNLQYFEEYVDESFDLKYVIFVANHYGPYKINVYGYVEPAK